MRARHAHGRRGRERHARAGPARHHRRAHRRVYLLRPRLPRLGARVPLARRPRARADHAQRRPARPPPPRSHRRAGGDGPARTRADGDVRRAGREAHVHLRAVPAGRLAARLRRARRLGGVERDRLREQRPRRAHQPLRRLLRHRLRRHRPCAGGRAPPDRAPPRSRRPRRLGALRRRARERCVVPRARPPARARGGRPRRGHRRPAARAARGPPEGDRRLGRLVGRRGDVPRGRQHARGRHARRRAAGRAARRGRRGHGARSARGARPSSRPHAPTPPSTASASARRTRRPTSCAGSSPRWTVGRSASPSGSTPRAESSPRPASRRRCARPA